MKKVGAEWGQIFTLYVVGSSVHFCQIERFDPSRFVTLKKENTL